MDAARELFETIRSGGAAAIHQMVADKWQEDLLLDFKCAEADSAPMSPKDRQSLAECLSCFANSDGGVIVWGVHARSFGPDDPDAAQQLKPIERLDLWLSNLQQHTPQVVAPAVPGVEHIAIPEAAGAQKGYAVTYIPKSQGEPHMARAKDQHRFYFRSGSSCTKMEPFMLADRYGRRPQPKLEAFYRTFIVAPQMREDDNYAIHLLFGIRNIGAGLARFPAVEIQHPPVFDHNPEGLQVCGAVGLPVGPPGEKSRSTFFTGNADQNIFPGRTLDVACYTTILSGVDLVRVGRVAFEFDLYCEGFSGKSTLEIGLESEIMHSYVPHMVGPR